MAMQHLWGRYFEDFTVGEVIKHWPGRTIREADDTWFTLLTMNTNPIHFDEHFASQSQHGRCLVNGTLVFSYGMGNGTGYPTWATVSVDNKLSRFTLNLRAQVGPLPAQRATFRPAGWGCARA